MRCRKCGAQIRDVSSWGPLGGRARASCAGRTGALSLGMLGGGKGQAPPADGSPRRMRQDRDIAC